MWKYNNELVFQQYLLVMDIKKLPVNKIILMILCS